MARNKSLLYFFKIQFSSLKRKALGPFALTIMALVTLGSCEKKEKEVPPPEIFLGDASDGLEVEVGDTIRIEPKITYNYNAQYEWRKDQQTLEYNGLNMESIALELGSSEYFFKVTTPTGADSVTIPVDVLTISDFQELSLEENQYWIGTTNTSGFLAQGIWFPNQFTNDETWWGFGYGNIFSKASTSTIDPYAAYSDLREGETFAIVKQTSDTNPPTLTFEDNKKHLIKSIEISNSTLGHYLMKYGDDTYQRLGGPSGTIPDWCKVTITGLNTENEPTGQIIVYLADYRFENNKRDYILDQWQVISLLPLGEVAKLQFSLSASTTNEENQMITPETFCIDNIKILN